MKRLIFALLFTHALSVIASSETTITLSISGQTVGELAVVKTLSDEDAAKLLAYIADKYAVGGTAADAVGNYAAVIMENTVQEVLSYEQDKAAEEARNAVQPIVVQ